MSEVFEMMAAAIRCNPRRRIKMIKWYFLLMLFPIAFVQAASEFSATPQEQAMCKALIYDRHDTSDTQNWGHMHHFCDCVRFTNRAMGNIGNDRNFEITRAIDGCDYVLSHTQPDFIMRGEVHLQKGKAFSLQGKDPLAAAEFIKALAINPKLVGGYNTLADLYVRTGKRREALNSVSEGLKHIPGSKSLQRRYTELGGKLPYPEPLEQAPPEKPALSDEPSATAPITPSSEQTPTPGNNSPEKPSPDEPSPNTSVPGAEKAIGNPANPWCRFCP
jgi:tetratricopeptide (TPR) repeat protein